VFNFGKTPLILSAHAVLSHDQYDLTVLDDMGFDVVNPRTNVGYVVRSDYEFIKGGLESFAKINTNGRWLLLVDRPIVT
jgi:hypothetical protein